MRSIIKNRPLTVIFLGLQGSGKGTQGQLLSDKYGFKVIETGSLIRKGIKNKTLPERDLALTSSGKLIRVATACDLVEKEIGKVSPLKGVVIDGSPRSMSETYSLMRALKSIGRYNNLFVIDLKISKETAFRRVSERLVCSACGRVFKEGHTRCHCGGKLERRTDDNVKILKNRLKFVSKNLDTIKAYFKKRNLLSVVNGEDLPKTIFKEITQKIGL